MAVNTIDKLQFLSFIFAVYIRLNHHMPNQRAKFKVSSFSHSEDILGG